MPTRILYHCPCSSEHSSSFGPVQPSSSSHQLPSLYFCEECNAIRCDQCTTKDLTAYYCPNCLFDVPLASIKTEKAKCPRNCFTCPICVSTILSVVASDRPGNAGDRWDPLAHESSVGEPPWYLACPTCRWDSKEVGLTFEKPTGLSLQMQRTEDNAADVYEFNQLRAHLDTYLRPPSDVGAASSAAARSSKLLRDVPSLTNDPIFGLNRRRQPTLKHDKDEQMPPFPASMTWDAGRDVNRYIGIHQGPEEGKAVGNIGRREENARDFMRSQTDDSAITDLPQRWASIAEQSGRVQDLGPRRMPLRTKQTKRCSTCRHIIIRPDSKPTSSRYKIRLLALNHLPEIQIRPPSTTVSVNLGEDRRRSAFASMSRRKVVAVDVDNLQPGRTYLFEASFLNPLDDPIAVRLHVARPPSGFHIDVKGEHGMASPDRSATASAASSKFSWTVTPSTSQFPVSAFNAVWELDEDESDLLDLARGDGRNVDNTDTIDEEDAEEDGEGDLVGDDREHKRSRTDIGGTREVRRKGQGILRRKGHETTVGLELALSRDAVGVIEFPMQVTYSYKSDTADVQPTTPARSSNSKDLSTTFSFWVFVRLGRVTSEVPVSGQHNAALQPLSPTSTAEARRAALDKRRSIIGLSLRSEQMPAFTPTKALERNPDLSPGHVQPPSPLSSLKEATIAADGSPRRRNSYGLTRRSSSNMASSTDSQTDGPTQARQRSAEDPSN